MNEAIKFLAIETFRLGDIVYFGSFISLLREKFPNSEIEILVSNSTRSFPFFKRLNILVHYFDFPWSHAGWHMNPFFFAKTLIALRNKFGRRFENYVVLDPRGDFRHRIIACILRPKLFIQHCSDAKWQDAFRGGSSSHIFISRQEYSRRIMSEFMLSSNAKLPWPWLSDFRIEHADIATRDVLLAPEASKKLKYWKSDNWKFLSRKLREFGWNVTLIIFKGDAVIDIRQDDFDNIWTGSIVDLTKLIGGARAVIAVDSFVGHLAAAIGTPVISLLGPQLAELWRPWGDQNMSITAKGYPCRPCNQKKCVFPKDNCMDAIQVDEVLYVFSDLIINSRLLPTS